MSIGSSVVRVVFPEMTLFSGTRLKLYHGDNSS